MITASLRQAVQSRARRRLNSSSVFHRHERRRRARHHGRRQNLAPALFGLLSSALVHASIAAASASPVILMPRWLRCPTPLAPAVGLIHARPIARKTKFIEADQADLGCPAPSAKIFLFFRNPNQRYIVSRPVPEEGRWPSSRTLGRDAVDADGAIDEWRLRRTEKSCGPDAPMLVSSSRLSAGDGGKKARSPGRARRKPLKPFRGECRVISGVT